MRRVLYTAAEAEASAVHEEWGSLAWKASANIGNAEGLTLGRVLIRRGHKNPRHTHNTTEEVLYLMRGRLRHTLGGEEYVLEAGDTLRIPPGVYHDAENIGEEDADMVVVYASGHRDFQRE